MNLLMDLVAFRSIRNILKHLYIYICQCFNLFSAQEPYATVLTLVQELGMHQTYLRTILVNVSDSTTSSTTKINFTLKIHLFGNETVFEIHWCQKDKVASQTKQKKSFKVKAASFP